MNLSGQAIKSGASQMATARYDCGSARPAAPRRLARSGHPLRLAMILQIPIGYEDETGFHRGEPRVQQTPPVFESEELNKDTYKF
jgi:hypothetical protein